ncbi:hypothetical protein TWF694_008305 [Orbilia ellipsospora]|uniref:PA14 domain-containing protein n=1 Tax=Orbilia ellipsospora TaxID=2528407 RepID=A0AAV9XH77_9PEZI
MQTGICISRTTEERSAGQISLRRSTSIYLHRTNILTKEHPAYISTGPAVTGADGAHCIYDKGVTAPIATDPTLKPKNTSNNIGIEVAIFDNPFTNNGTIYNTTYAPEYFGTATPYGTNTTTRLGFYATSSPAGFSPRQDTAASPVYALNYRGYFYASKTQSYIFRITSADDIAGMWVGDKAFSRWSQSNADALVRHLDGNQTAVYNITLFEGSYTPFRPVFGNANGAGSYSVDIIGNDGIFYAASGSTSDFLVQKACDGSTKDFPNYGKEAVTPDRTCNNAGFEVADFYNPYSWTGTEFVNWDPTYFKTQPPVSNGTTDLTNQLIFYNTTVPGLAARPANYTAYMWRAYFCAPIEETYTFTLSKIDAYANMWLGADAYSGWTAANAAGGVFLQSSAVIVRNLTAGQWYAVRILLGDNGGTADPGNGANYLLSVGDSSGFRYLGENMPTAYLVGQDCAGDLPPFRPWG